MENLTTAAENVAGTNVSEMASVVVMPLQNMLNQVVAFGPKLIGAVIILLFGMFVARMLGHITTKVFTLVKLDLAVEKIGADEWLRKGGITKTFTEMMGKAVYYIILLFVFKIVFDKLGLSAVNSVIDSILGYMPGVLGSIVMLIVGALIANMARDVVTSIAKAGGLSAAGMLGNIVHHLIIFFVAITAAEQVGVDTSIVTGNLNIIIAGFVAAGALAIGLGARAAGGNVVSSFYAKQFLSQGDNVQIGDVEGTVSAITAATIVVKTTDGEVAIPANKVMEENIIKK